MKPTKKSLTKSESKAALKAQEPTTRVITKADLDSMTAARFKASELQNMPFWITGAEVDTGEYGDIIVFSILLENGDTGSLTMAYHENRYKFVQYFEQGNEEPAGPFLTTQLNPKKPGMQGAWIFRRTRAEKPENPELPF